MTTVLVLDPDVDALGRLGETLGKKGLTPVLAQTIAQAEDRARERAPRVFLVAASLVDNPSLGDALARSFALGELPRLVLRHAPKEGSLPPGCVGREDADKLVARVLEAARESGTPSAPSEEFRGDVSQAPLLDVLRLLAARGRTGTLLLRSSHGAGELRLDHGELVGATFRHFEGEKAVSRVLSTEDGTFSFSPGVSPGPRRIARAIEEVVGDVARQRDVWRGVLDALGGASAIVAKVGRPAATTELARRILPEVAERRELADLLDELPARDLDVLEALRELIELGLVEGARGESDRAILAPPEELPVLRSVAGRLQRPGFAGIRVGVFGPMDRLVTLGQTLVRGLAASPPLDPPPELPVPHELGRLLLGDGVEVSVLAVPSGPTGVPLARLALPAVRVVVCLEGLDVVLSRLVMELGIRALPAGSSSLEFDPSSAEATATLLRRSLEDGASG